MLDGASVCHITLQIVSTCCNIFYGHTLNIVYTFDSYAIKHPVCYNIFKTGCGSGHGTAHSLQTLSCRNIVYKSLDVQCVLVLIHTVCLFSEGALNIWAQMYKHYMHTNTLCTPFPTHKLVVK